MIDFLETTKRHAGLMLSLLIIGYILCLVILQLAASVAEDFPIKDEAPQSESTAPNPSQQPANGCRIFDDLTICPEGVEPPQ